MEEKKNFSVIYNPIAARYSKQALAAIIEAFEARGLVLNRCACSEYSGHVIPLIKELDPISDYVITLGGDGTANEAVRAFNAIEQHSVYCHISAGTTNDMANNFGLSRKDPIASARKLAEQGKEGTIDSFIVNGEPVTYVSAFGYVAPIPYITSIKLKKVLRHAAYVISAIPIVLKKPEKLAIRYTADGTTKEIVTCLGLITSSKGMGGVTLYPNADLNSGKMDVFFLKEFKPSIVPVMFSKYVTDTLDLKELSQFADVFSTDELEIEFIGDLPQYEPDNDGNCASFTIKDSDRKLRYTMGKKIKMLIP